MGSHPFDFQGSQAKISGVLNATGPLLIELPQSARNSNGRLGTGRRLGFDGAASDLRVVRRGVETTDTRSDR